LNLMNSRFGLDCRRIGRTGIGRYVESLARKLGPRGVRLFCSPSPVAEEFRSRGWDVRRVRSEVFSLAEQWELSRALRREPLQVFHSPQFNLPVFSSVRRITTVHDCTLDRFPEIMPSGYARLYYRMMMRAAVRKSAAVIVPTRATKEDLLSFYVLPEERITVNPLGVDPSQFRPASKSEDEAAGPAPKNLPGNPALLYVGTSHPHKNLRRLMRALRLITEAVPETYGDLKLVCAGPFTRRFPRPSELARQESVGRSVIETGEISDDELVRLMRAATILVLPSLNEGFGLPALEAMACGLPVLLSGIPALRETAGEAAEYFEPSSEEDLTGRLRFLLENSSRRAELTEKGLRRAAQFSWDACAGATLQVYERVAMRPARRATRTPA
jgi:glycosyltransferase involved in cell wall biosynthesis